MAAVRDGADAATPSRAGRGGHPVALRARVLDVEEPRPLRDVLADLGPLRARLEVDDPGIAIDLDTPDDVKRVTGAPPRFASFFLSRFRERVPPFKGSPLASLVGQSIARVDGPAKVRGSAMYIDDYVVPGALHGGTVRSEIRARTPARHP